jgi:hypothetical protein
VNLPLRTCDDHRTTPNRERGASPPPSTTATGGTGVAGLSRMAATAPLTISRE